MYVARNPVLPGNVLLAFIYQLLFMQMHGQEGNPESRFQRETF